MEECPADLIISEVRVMQDTHAARFNHDVAVVFHDIRSMQKESGLDCLRHPRQPAAVSSPNGDLSGDGIDVPVARHGSGLMAREPEAPKQHELMKACPMQMLANRNSRKSESL